MDLTNSSSSDSELESKIKLRRASFRKTDTGQDIFLQNVCLICLEGGDLVNSQEKSKKIECTKERMTNCHDDKYMRHIFSKFDDLKNQRFLKWHKNCYKSYTSSKNIAPYKSKNAKLTADIPADFCRGDIFQKRPLRHLLIHKNVYFVRSDHRIKN